MVEGARGPQWVEVSKLGKGLSHDHRVVRRLGIEDERVATGGTDAVRWARQVGKVETFDRQGIFAGGAALFVAVEETVPEIGSSRYDTAHAAGVDGHACAGQERPDVTACIRGVDSRHLEIDGGRSAWPSQ
jgi:hypothetical protein